MRGSRNLLLEIFMSIWKMNYERHNWSNIPQQQQSEAIIIILMQPSRLSRKTSRKSFHLQTRLSQTLIASSFVYFCCCFFSKKNRFLSIISDEVWFGNIWWCCCCCLVDWREMSVFYVKISKSYLFSSLCILLTASLIAFPK